MRPIKTMRSLNVFFHKRLIEFCLKSMHTVLLTVRNPHV